ncbi:MAG: Hsp20/alpha crystallin family protein [Porphyromonas sp.]|nr:Hsp20/alpha crystallin family protein [Porphyromonas sp.]
MRRGFYDLFDALWNSEMPAVTYRKVSSPAVNVMESEVDYVVQIAAPGLTKEDVSIKLDEEENLVISMQKKEEYTTQSPESVDNVENETEEARSKEVAKVDEKPVRYLRREFLNESFVQRMTLPEDTDLDGISARVENGVLEVTIKKIREADKIQHERTISVD